MGSSAFRVPAGLTLRRASAADNRLILDFMRTQRMDAGMQLRFDRSPDYFALLEAHSGDHETWLVSKGEQVVAAVSFIHRQAWVNEQVEPVIYMADLRVARQRSVAGIWRTLMPQLLDAMSERTGARLAYCSILRDNIAARRALLRSDRGETPEFVHLYGYSTVSVVARKPWAARHSSSMTVRRAGRPDKERLRTFLNEQSQATELGPVFDEPYFSRRLELWPDFGLEHFWIAFDAANEIIGCLAPWDSSSISRIVLERLSPSANLVRQVCNLLTPLTRRPWIRTGPSSALPDIALTHVFVRDRDARVLAALLDSAQRNIFASRRYATMSLCLYDQDPMWLALSDYWHVSVPMDLFVVSAGGDNNAEALVRSDAFRQRFPGFEHYLV